MKKSRFFFFGGLLSVAVIALALSAFWAGKAYAATGCFNDTNGHWAETFICWMKDNNITTGIGGGNYGPEQFVTRAQMAVFMQRASNVPPQTGNIYVVMGPDEWFQNRTSPVNLTFSRYYTDVSIISSAEGIGYIIGIPDLPTSMYGRALSLSGVEICYTAAATAVLTQFDLYVDTQTAGVSSTFVNLATDPTDRTDAACRLYTFTPVALTGKSIVNMKVHVNWTNTLQAFYLGRATFVLQPTESAVTPLDITGAGVEAPALEFTSPRD
ncbi:MAG: S-layer homology domain-containing protein [Anaerolineales bacterium]